MLQALRKFLALEEASALVLIVAAALAIMLANSSLADHYHIMASPPVRFVINDILMVIFFLTIGIEIKHEILHGELAGFRRALLPVMAALGGIAVPALIYTYFNQSTPLMRGWAIPTATDIAFSLGVLGLFSRRIPISLKVFLLAVAVADDLAAVIIIAVFYTEQVAMAPLMAAAACTMALILFGRYGLNALWPYLLAGAALWTAILYSGVHPTVAGVLMGLAMPQGRAQVLGQTLHPWVAFGIMPLFALANAGVPLAGLSFEQLSQPLAAGVMLGLFLGKQTGIFMTSWLLIRLGLASLPENARWPQFYAICLLAGIGFTMSLFIGSLSFNEENLQHAIRLGVLIGSLLSALSGAFVLSMVRHRNSEGL